MHAFPSVVQNHLHTYPKGVAVKPRDIFSIVISPESYQTDIQKELHVPGEFRAMVTYGNGSASQRKIAFLSEPQGTVEEALIALLKGTTTVAEQKLEKAANSLARTADGWVDKELVAEVEGGVNE